MTHRISLPSCSRSCSRSRPACCSAATCSTCSAAGGRCSIPCSCRSSGWCCGSRAWIANQQQDWKQVLAVAAGLERLHVAGDVDDRHRCSRRCRSIPTASPTWSRRSRSTRSRASRRTPTCSTTAARPGLSYLSQMFVITFLQFVTAATGVAACIAIIRGLGGQPADRARQLLRRPDARHRPRVPAAGDCSSRSS